MKKPAELKPVVFLGSSRGDLQGFPKSATYSVGKALYEAQLGRHPKDAKPLKGFGGAGVLEVVEQSRGNAYRAVYTVRFATVIYVLHVFQKKSASERKTQLHEVERIKARLKEASVDYAERVSQSEAGRQEGGDGVAES